jgi:hypothetical protein
MPHEFTSFGTYCVVRVHGVFTPEELNAMATEIEIIEAPNPDAIDRITDITGVEEFRVGFDDIFAFAIRRGLQRFSRTIKSAIIVAAPVQLGIARVYESLNENPQIQLRILRSSAKAIDWFAQIDPPVG